MLWIPSFLMSRASWEVNVDQGFGFRRERGQFLAFGCAQFQEVPKGEADTASETCVEELTA
jgi:hypothetical protein